MLCIITEVNLLQTPIQRDRLLRSSPHNPRQANHSTHSPPTKSRLLCTHCPHAIIPPRGERPHAHRRSRVQICPSTADIEASFAPSRPPYIDHIDAVRRSCPPSNRSNLALPHFLYRVEDFTDPHTLPLRPALTPGAPAYREPVLCAPLCVAQIVHALAPLLRAAALSAVCTAARACAAAGAACGAGAGEACRPFPVTVACSSGVILLPVARAEVPEEGG
jgi:hypothetical protein